MKISKRVRLEYTKCVLYAKLYANAGSDELVKLHKSMVEITAEANSALARATNQANTVLIQLQGDFSLAKQTFQEQLMQDLDASTAKTQSFLERLMKSMDAAVQSAISHMDSATKEIELNTAGVSQNVRQANTDSMDLQKNIGKVFQQVVEGGAELAATQTQQWDQSRELATELQGSLQNLRESEVSALLGVFHSIHEQLASAGVSMNGGKRTNLR